jgi:hypothetical protein
MKQQLLLLATFSLLTAAKAQNDPSATVGDTGTVSFVYQGNTVTYTTVRGADGMIWLQQNLGASQVATSSTDASAYGHYFQWGRWDDGHQVSTSPTAPATTINPNDPSGISGGNPNFLTGNNPADWWSGGAGTDTWSAGAPSPNNGTDPCSMISPGWHLPSQPEFANAITVEGITNASTAFSSNLKLTVGGQRDAINASMNNVGLYGAYWTSSANNLYADAVAIQPGAIVPADLAYRSYGFNLRCMTSCTGVFDPISINGDDTVCQGSTNTYSVPAVNNANGYMWTVPTGWTIVGSSSGSTISVMAGSAGGSITVKAMNNCDTSNAMSMTVAVDPLPMPVIMASGNVLSAGTYTGYQWMVNDTVITGATNAIYMAMDTGAYQVIVTDTNGCSDTSAVYNYTVGIGSIPGVENISVYPNPASSVLNISAPYNVDIVIYSIEGRVVLQQANAQHMDVSRLAAGVYQIRLNDEQGRLLKVEKLVITRE